MRRIKLKKGKGVLVHVVNGRTVTFVEGKVYEMDDAEVHYLLNTGLFKEVRSKVSYMTDRALISTESHEQRYMRKKLGRLTLKKLQNLAVTWGVASEGLRKRALCEALALKAAEINDRKTVNADIKAIKKGAEHGE